MFLKYGFALFASILTSAAVHAAVYTVGSDGACNYTTIAAAAVAAEAHPGADTINVAFIGGDAANAYPQQAITISASQELDIVGGFTDCSQAASSGSHVVIDGAGGVTDPVFRITVATGGLVRLSYLTIQHGDEDGSGKGGGIYFKGNGILELNHVTVTQNTAGSGGGIYAEGTGDETELVIGEDVAIVGNTARFDGGGVVNDGTEMTMTQPDSYIAFNHAANGYGGGLYVRGDDRKAYTYLGSTGLGNVGAIYLNDAARGGGVALHSSDDLAALHMFATDPARPIRIKGNTASIEGGGIYLGPAGAATELWAWDFWIEDNIAPHGAAIFDGDESNTLAFNDANFRPLGSIDCPIGTPCGGIVGNTAENDASQLTGGIVEFVHFDALNVNRTTIEGNTGKYVFYSGGSVFLRLQNSAVVGNTVSDSVIVAEDEGGYPKFENATIAGNSIGADTVLRLGNNGHGTLHRSIIWQPGKTTLQLHGDPLDLFDDMVSERGSVDQGNSPYVKQQDPRFIDPAHGDYGLRASSPAVDLTTPVAGDDRDLYSNARDVNLPIVNGLYVRDLGAIERQTLQPLVLNSDFNADLRLWNVANAGVTTWDVTKNISGPTGSGSAHITLPSASTGTQTGGIVQCVHLPGPGLYALNGFGHGTGAMFTVGDMAILYWEYRKIGGENCTDGAQDATGQTTIANGNNWTKPTTPAYIDASQQWTYTSSIAVTLVAREFGSGAPTNAWFDGITLGIDGDDTIFADDFD